MTYILPDLVWGNLFPTQVAIDLVVAPVLAMVCKVGLGIVDLAHQQKLAIVELFDFVGSHFFNYARIHLFCKSCILRNYSGIPRVQGRILCSPTSG